MNTRTLASTISVVLLAGGLAACGGGGGSTASSAGGTTSPTYSVSGTVSGLPSGESVVLLNNGGSAQTINVDGNFSFTGLADGSSYLIRVGTHPSSASCVVVNGRGTINAADVTGVEVKCQTKLTGDQTFGQDFNGNGIPDGYITRGGSANDEIFAVARDSQGRIYTAVVDDVAIIGSVAVGKSAVVRRYNEDGTLDTSFGTNGSVVLATGVVVSGTVFNYYQNYANAIAIDSNGKIVVAGRKDGDMAVWRLNEDGSWDTTFASNGTFTHDGAAGGSGVVESGEALALQGDGKIVVAGYGINAAGNKDVVVWRLHPDGSLDVDTIGYTGFSTNGYYVLDLSSKFVSPGRDDWAEALAIRSDGRILVAGSVVGAGADRDMFILQLDTKGDLDRNFGRFSLIGGNRLGWEVTNGAPDHDDAFALALDEARNRIYVAGRSQDTNGSGGLQFDPAVWALELGGRIVGAPEFSNNSVGIARITSLGGDDQARDIVVDAATGDLILAGQVYAPPGGFVAAGYFAALMRMNRSGQVVTTWGLTGVTPLQVLSGANTAVLPGNQANALLVDDQGRYVAGGFFNSATSANRKEEVVWRVVP